MRGNDNGRLAPDARGTSRVLAHFYGRLIGVFLLVVGGVVHAQSGCAVYDSVMAQCQEALTAKLHDYPGGSTTPGCTASKPDSDPGHYVIVGKITYQGSVITGFPNNEFRCPADIPPSAAPCASLVPVKSPQTGGLHAGQSICSKTLDPVSGGFVQCKVSLTPISPPVGNAFSGGLQSYVLATPTGGLCGGDEPTGLHNADNSTVPPSVAPTPIIPAANTDPPKVCGGASCYDPKSNQYCASGDAGQVCVPAPNPGPSPDPGTCGSNGQTTLCAGNPQAPAPPKNSVPDPATQTRGNDGYTTADPTTGALGHTGVGAYSNSGGTGVTSGQSSGDKGPAGSSTAPGGTGNSATDKHGNSASGGGNCDNPPQCSGDAILCASLTQQFQTKCAISDVPVSASSSPGNLPADGSSAYQPDAATDVGIGGTGLDDSGWLARSCPIFAVVPVAGTVLDLNNSHWCDFLQIGGVLVLVGAYLRSARILAGA